MTTWTKTRRGIENGTHVIAPATRTAGYAVWVVRDGVMWDQIATVRTIAEAKALVG
jgi:hypothetical protein